MTPTRERTPATEHDAGHPDTLDLTLRHDAWRDLERRRHTVAEGVMMTLGALCLLGMAGLVVYGLWMR